MSVTAERVEKRMISESPGRSKRQVFGIRLDKGVTRAGFEKSDDVPFFRQAFILNENSEETGFNRG